MYRAFKRYQGDVEVGRWDTSNVVDMTSMFNEAHMFNCDIGSWDTSKVTNAVMMFYGATNFKRDLSEWNLGSVDEYTLMFTRSGIENEEAKKPKKVRVAAPQDMRSAGSAELVFGRASPRAYV